jgi:hypothetical protein
LTKVNMKDVRDAIRTELKLTRLNPEDWKVVKEGITQAARTVLVCGPSCPALRPVLYSMAEETSGVEWTAWCEPSFSVLPCAARRDGCQGEGRDWDQAADEQHFVAGPWTAGQETRQR